MNNVIISLCDKKGEVKKQFTPATTGGYKKSKRGSYYGGQVTAIACLEYIIEGMGENRIIGNRKASSSIYRIGRKALKCYIRIRGLGEGRDGALKELVNKGRNSKA
jgi:ribosomal protein S11